MDDHYGLHWWQPAYSDWIRVRIIEPLKLSEYSVDHYSLLGNDNYDTVKERTGESYEQPKKFKKLKIWIVEKFWEFVSEKGAKPWIIKAWLMNCSTTLSCYKNHVYTVLLVLKLGWCDLNDRSESHTWALNCTKNVAVRQLVIFFLNRKNCFVFKLTSVNI